MRLGSLLLSIVLIASLTTACDDSSSNSDRQRSSEEYQDQIDDVQQEVEIKREVLKTRLREAEEQIREELESLQEDDLVTREDLEDLRQRIERSADRIQEDLQETDKDFESSMRDLGAALEKIGAAIKEDSDIEPIGHRKLLDLLPREVAGLERYDTDGSTNSVLGIKTSKVTGKYDGGLGDMSITIIDLGSISGAASVGLELVDARIDRESDRGIERTTEIDGYPAFLSVEEEGNRQKRGAMIRVTDRFIVLIEAEGAELDEDLIEQVVDRISLRRLARLGRR